MQGTSRRSRPSCPSSSRAALYGAAWFCPTMRRRLEDRVVLRQPSNLGLVRLDLGVLALEVPGRWPASTLACTALRRPVSLPQPLLLCPGTTAAVKNGNSGRCARTSRAARCLTGARSFQHHARTRSTRHGPVPVCTGVFRLPSLACDASGTAGHRLPRRPAEGPRVAPGTVRLEAKGVAHGGERRRESHEERERDDVLV